MARYRPGVRMSVFIGILLVCSVRIFLFEAYPWGKSYRSAAIGKREAGRVTPAVNHFQSHSVVRSHVMKLEGRKAVLVEGNALDRAICEGMVRQTTESLGGIDILISNPAVSRRGDFLEYDPETFATVLQGTVMGGFHISQLVARGMVERGLGG